MQIGVVANPAEFTQVVEGLDYVETTVTPSLVPLEDEAVFAAKLEAAKACPLPVPAANCFFPGSLKSTGPDVDGAALDAYVATVMSRAERFGMKYIVYGSGGSRRVPEGFDHARAADQIVGHLQRWGPIAGDHGITIALEPLNAEECNIVTTVGEGAELVRRADHPAIRLLADTYHMAKDGDPPDAIRAAGDLIVHTHCGEGDGRGPIGTKGEDHRPYFRALKDIGFDGMISIEVKWRDREAQLPGAVAELRRQIEDAVGSD